MYEIYTAVETSEIETYLVVEYSKKFINEG